MPRLGIRRRRSILSKVLADRIQLAGRTARFSFAVSHRLLASLVNRAAGGRAADTLGSNRKRLGIATKCQVVGKGFLACRKGAWRGWQLRRGWKRNDKCGRQIQP